MTDRELLEFAAKAAGMKYGMWAEKGEVLPDKGGFVQYMGMGLAAVWNPLTDDGDALRLLVAKRFTIKDFAPCENPEIAKAPADAALWGMVEIWRQDDEDPLHVEWYKAGADREAVTRRAIVSAAAVNAGRVIPADGEVRK
jgi:hypothetical protein